LPVIGALFRSEEYVRSETELVVIVTPVLVRAANASALATPGEALPDEARVLAASSAKNTGAADFSDAERSR
jgi:pilus assembly protein CpaC